MSYVARHLVGPVSPRYVKARNAARARVLRNKSFLLYGTVVVEWCVSTSNRDVVEEHHLMATEALGEGATSKQAPRTV